MTSYIRPIFVESKKNKREEKKHNCTDSAFIGDAPEEKAVLVIQLAKWMQWPNQVKPVQEDCIFAQNQGASSTFPSMTIVERKTVSPRARAANQPSFALEVFAGTTRLTACLRSLGLVDSVGIDCSMPTRLNGPIIKLDLLQPTPTVSHRPHQQRSMSICALCTTVWHIITSQADTKGRQANATSFAR